MTKIKGWSMTEVNHRIALRALQAQVYRSPRQERAEFDTVWGEWVIVTSYPGELTTINRKPRSGLARDKTYRVTDQRTPTMDECITMSIPGSWNYKGTK